MVKDAFVATPGKKAPGEEQEHRNKKTRNKEA